MQDFKIVRQERRAALFKATKQKKIIRASFGQDARLMSPRLLRNVSACESSSDVNLEQLRSALES